LGLRGAREGVRLGYVVHLPLRVVVSTYGYLCNFMIINLSKMWCKVGMRPLDSNYLFMKCRNYKIISSFFASYLSMDLASCMLSNFTPLMTIISIEP
jgi:hypothetical protein